MSVKYSTATKYKLNNTMFDKKNIWLLKPTDYNRGRGVSLFSTIDQFKKLIKDY